MGCITDHSDLVDVSADFTGFLTKDPFRIQLLTHTSNHLEREANRLFYCPLSPIN